MSVLLGAEPSGFFLRSAIGVVAASIIALAGLRARALTKSGAFAAILVGAAVYAGAGAACAAAMIVFFATGSALSRMRGGASARRSLDSKATRDARQVLANGAAAASCALASAALRAFGAAHAADGLAIAAIVSLAGVAGDTWASEIGSRIGGRPRLITTLARVKPRTSGAVTWIGCVAAVCGGAIVACAAALFGFAGGFATAAAIGALAGLVGSTIDSLLGASVQAVWHCGACDDPSDDPSHACGAAASYVRGVVGVDNDAVNALMSASLAAVVAIAGVLF